MNHYLYLNKPEYYKYRGHKHLETTQDSSILKHFERLKKSDRCIKLLKDQ